MRSLEDYVLALLAERTRELLPLGGGFTDGNERRLRRWKHGAMLKAMQTRLNRAPDALTEGRSIVVHQLCTLKLRIGWHPSSPEASRTWAPEVSIPGACLQP